MPSPKTMDTLDLHVPQDQEHSDTMAWAMDMEGVVLVLLMAWVMDMEGLALVLHQQLLLPTCPCPLVAGVSYFRIYCSSAVW